MANEKDGGPKLKRDEHNILDRDEARKLNEELLKKFKDESQRFNKDETLHHAKTGRRDIIVHAAVTILAQVDGHPVMGEVDKEYGQWCFRMNAENIPWRRPILQKALAELIHLCQQSIAKIGGMRD